MAKQGALYEPSDADREFVDRSVMSGAKILDIAEALNIHDDTLRKYYRYEIVTARQRLKNESVRVLCDHLHDNSLDAAKFVLARVAGWSENVTNKHTGPEGGPIQGEIVYRIVDPAKDGAK